MHKEPTRESFQDVFDGRRSFSRDRLPTSPKNLRSSAVLVGRTTRLQSMSSTWSPLAASSSLSGIIACLVQYSDDWRMARRVKRLRREAEEERQKTCSSAMIGGGFHAQA